LRFFAFAVVLLSAASAHAQALGSCTPELIGSPSCPYQWVGFTSVSYVYDSSNPETFGFAMLTAQCRADFGPGTRMCTSEEVLSSDTLNPAAIPSSGAWLRPTWVGGTPTDESGRTSNQGFEALSCGGWFGNNTGLTLLPGGKFGTAGCSITNGTPLPATCCKPIAVGEPQASMMLPAGIGALAVISAFRVG
jgi:hypothetical protein